MTERRVTERRVTERLAIVGASVRAAAASAVRAGFRVAAADLFADADLESIATATQVSSYPNGLVDWLRGLQPRPVAWMYTGALENYPELVDEMSALAQLWGNPGDVLRQVRSPLRLAEALQNAGFLFPEMRDSPTGLPRDGSWLAKTGRGASGSGVRAWSQTRRHRDKETGSEESAGIANTSPCLPLSLSPCLFFQRLVPGKPCSAVYVGTGHAAELLGVVRQFVGEPWLGAREFQYCGAVGPWPVTEAALRQIRRIGDVLAACFGLRGLFGVDFVLEDDRVWTIEVNPRYPASAEILERATGIRLIASHAVACQASRFAVALPHEATALHGKAIVFARRAVTVANELRNESQEAQPINRWPAFGDVPRVGTGIEPGRPILTVFADGATPDEVVANLQARVAIVERQLYA